MKHLEKFDKYKDKINLNEIDFNFINTQFLNKIEESGLEPNPQTIYSDLELLKKDKNNSFIFWIVREYLKNNDYRLTTQNIMRTSAKFFEVIYNDIIKKYKTDLKTEFNVSNNKNGNFLLLPYGDEIVKVPGKIGHGYIPLKILPLDELRTKYSRHKRLKTFHVKGLKCVSCPREGKYLIAAKDSTGAIHIDV